MTNSHDELVRRIALLDEWSAEFAPYLRSDDPRTIKRVGRELLRGVVEVLSYHSALLRDVSTGETVRRARDNGTPNQVTPDDADSVVASSSILAALLQWAPEIVTGPISLTAQQWTSHGRIGGPPSHLDLVPVSHATDDDAVRDKPIRCGFYTSTGVFDHTSMWQTYLRHGTDGRLFPRPWRAWSVVPATGARVREVTTATDWADLVCRHGVAVDGLLTPDWRRISRVYDAVHMTVRAVLATQGLQLTTNRGLIVPSNWDVESTLWLDWSIHSYALIGEIETA